MKSIHVATARRLLLGWLCVSLLIGGASYWYGLRQLGQQLILVILGAGLRLAFRAGIFLQYFLGIGQRALQLLGRVAGL